MRTAYGRGRRVCRVHSPRVRLPPGGADDAACAGASRGEEEVVVPTVYSIAWLLLHALALGAGYGVVCPRELMLLARAPVSLEAAAAVIDPDVSVADFARPLMSELRRALLLDPPVLEEAWRENRFEYLDLVLDLPDLLLPELAERLRDGGAPQPHPPEPGAAPRWLPVAAGFLADAVVTRSVGRRR